MSNNVVRNSLRVPELDFVKGALVLIMVLYHWLNYFLSSEGDYYRYLRFLTPSFIFITGFLISHVYIARGPTDFRAAHRLMQRGLKVLAVFIVLNAARAFIVPDARSGVMPTGGWTGPDLVAIFVSGNIGITGGPKPSAFNILIPISYLLLLSSALFGLQRHYRNTFHYASVIALLLVGSLRFFNVQYGILELVTIGLLGASAGHLGIETVDSAVKRWYVLAIVYALYLLALAEWNATFPLQVFGVFICCLIIYRFGKFTGSPGLLRQGTVLLGKYSLFGYIAQIAILQLVYRLVSSNERGLMSLAVSLCAAFILTVVTVVVLDRARRRAPIVDRLYLAVFA